MKDLVKKRRQYQDVLCYIAGYYILNKDVPTLLEIAKFAKQTKQNISDYMKKYFRDGYLIPLPDRAHRKYKINFHKIKELSEAKVEALFNEIAFGTAEDSE